MMRIARESSRVDLDARRAKHLRDVVKRRRSPKDRRCETRAFQNRRPILTDFAEDGIAPIAAGMSDPGRKMMDRSIGVDDRAREGPGNVRSPRNRPQGQPSRLKNAAELAERGG